MSPIPRDAQGAVGTLLRMIFAERDHSSAMAKLREVARALETRSPQAAELLEEASEDLLSHSISHPSTGAGCTPPPAIG